MASREELTFTPGQWGVVYEKIHLDGWRIDLHKFDLEERLADQNLLKTGQTYDVTCPGMPDLDPVQSSMSEQRGNSPPLAPAVLMNADDGIPNLDPSADDPAKREPAQVI